MSGYLVDKIINDPPCTKKQYHFLSAEVAEESRNLHEMARSANRANNNNDHQRFSAMARELMDAWTSYDTNLGPDGYQRLPD